MKNRNNEKYSKKARKYIAELRSTRFYCSCRHFCFFAVIENLIASLMLSAIPGPFSMQIFLDSPSTSSMFDKNSTPVFFKSKCNDYNFCFSFHLHQAFAVIGQRIFVVLVVL